MVRGKKAEVSQLMLMILPLLLLWWMDGIIGRHYSHGLVLS